MHSSATTTRTAVNVYGVKLKHGGLAVSQYFIHWQNRMSSPSTLLFHEYQHLKIKIYFTLFIESNSNNIPMSCPYIWYNRELKHTLKELENNSLLRLFFHKLDETTFTTNLYHYWQSIWQHFLAMIYYKSIWKVLFRVIYVKGHKMSGYPMESYWTAEVCSKHDYCSEVYS